MIDILVNNEVVDTVNNVKISTNMFRDNSIITDVNLKNYDWENNSASQAFANCSNLTSVTNLSNNINDISSMFYNCSSLTNTINIPNSVTNKTHISIYEMMKCYISDEFYDISAYDEYTGREYNVNTNMFYIFKYYYPWDPNNYEERIGIIYEDNVYPINGWIMENYDEYIYFEFFNQTMGNWEYIYAFRNSEFDREDTSHPTTTGLYQNCYSLINGEIISENITELPCAFQSCENLMNVNIVCPSLNNSKNILNNCHNLRNVSITGNNVDLSQMFRSFPIHNVSLNANYANLQYTFSDCQELENIFLNINMVYNMEGTFQGCYNLVNAPVLPNNVTKMNYTFDSCHNLVNAPILPNNIIDMEGIFGGCGLIDAPVIPNGVINMNRAFCYCHNLVNAPVIPNSVTSMEAIFDGCTNLVNVPVIPNSVTGMSYTFQECQSLVNVPVIPNSVTNMYGTFSGCLSLIDAPVIPNSVTNMVYTFQGCSNLVNAPVLPDGITETTDIFHGCSNLVNAPDIPSGVSYIAGTFGQCYNLTGRINIYSSIVGDVNNIFYQTSLDKDVFIPFRYNIQEDMYCWRAGWVEDNNYPQILYTKTEQPLIETEHQLFYSNGNEFTYDLISDYNGNEIYFNHGYYYYRDTNYDMIPNEYTLTYNTFINAGYTEERGKEGVALIDIDGNEIHFDITSILDYDIYLNDNLVRNNVGYGQQTYNEYVIKQNNKFTIGHLRDLIKGETYIVTKDLDNINYSTITLSTGISGLDVSFSTSKKIFYPYDDGNGNYTFFMNTDEEITIKYLINGGSTYMDVNGNITFNNQDVTKNIVMVLADDDDWTQPILSSNGILGGDSFAVKSQSQADLWDVYKAFDNDMSTYWWIPWNNDKQLIIYNPEGLNIQQIIWNYNGTYSHFNSMNVYGSNNNSNWEQLTSNYSNSGNYGTLNVSANNYYKYYKFEFGDNSYHNIYEIQIIATYKVPHTNDKSIDLTEYDFNIENNTIKIGRYNGIDTDVTLPELIDENEGE